MNTEEFSKRSEVLVNGYKDGLNSDELQEIHEALAKILENVRETFEKLAKILNEAFNCSGVSTKKRYVRTKRIEVHHCKKYDYIPVARKNLPYQRRNY